jgi:hypothetical protein
VRLNLDSPNARTILGRLIGTQPITAQAVGRSIVESSTWCSAEPYRPGGAPIYNSLTWIATLYGRNTLIPRCGDGGRPVAP